MPAYSPDAPTADEVRAALRQVLASPPFRPCPRLASFLRFVVEEELAGRSARIKAYAIGIEALGRGTNFDPQIDPIVRVEAVRLRRALARYYAQHGADAAVLIELPRGRYVPAFQRRRQAGCMARLRGTLRMVRRLLSARVLVSLADHRG